MWTGVALLLVLAPQDPPADARDLQTGLARAIDLPTPAARAAAADELAKKPGVPLAAWTAACATFGTFARLEAGPSHQQVPLQVLDQAVKTDVYLYVPAGYDPQKPAPLLLWGHGAGGTGAREYLLWQDVADRAGLLVLAITSIEPAAGYHFSPRERGAALAALRWARRQANVDENAVFVGGWSQGGHQAWDLALRFPDLFAGALPIVGGPRLEPGPKNNLRYLENVGSLPIRDLQGSQDDPKLLANLHLAFSRLAKLGAKDCQLIEFPDRGHDADITAVDWTAFFATRRTAVPRRVARLAAEPTEGRASWLELVKWSAKATPAAVPEVPAGYDALDDARQRAMVLDRYGELTARVVAEDKGQGRFHADGRLVSAFAFLLTAAQLGKDGAVEIRLQGQSKAVKKKVPMETSVLLREFVERFDRTFLPVARVTVP